MKWNTGICFARLNMKRICRWLFVGIIGMHLPLIAEKKEPDTQQLLQCNAIFEARKNEITQSLRTLNEKMQNLEAYKNATQNLLAQKEANLKEQEKAFDAKMQQAKAEQAKIAQKNEEEKKMIQDLIAKNEALLKEIQGSSNSKVAKTFSGMKDSKAAPIIAELDDAEAAEILSSLTASEMAKILAKMDARRAAELTKIIAKGPPFKSTTKPQKSTPPGAKDESTDDPDKKSEAKDSDVQGSSDRAQRDFQDFGGI